jgi:hypothetical protein
MNRGLWLLVVVAACRQSAPSDARTSIAITVLADAGTATPVTLDAGSAPAEGEAKKKKKRHKPKPGQCREDRHEELHAVVAWEPGPRPTTWGIDRPQGPYLEGPVLERFQFKEPNTWPPSSGRLVGIDACNSKRELHLQIRSCDGKPNDATRHCIVSKQPTFKPALEKGDERRLCNADGTNHQDARILVTRGRWDEGGTYIEESFPGEPKYVTLSCASEKPRGTSDQRYLWNGAITKCHDLLNPHNLAGNAALMQTCTRLMRADYCGHGIPHTIVGTRIKVWPYPLPNDAECVGGFCFEASWDQAGATCIGHLRYPAATRPREFGEKKCLDDWDENRPVSCAEGTQLLMTHSKVHVTGAAGTDASPYREEDCDAGVECRYPPD